MKCWAKYQSPWTWDSVQMLLVFQIATIMSLVSLVQAFDSVSMVNRISEASSAKQIQIDWKKSDSNVMTLNSDFLRIVTPLKYTTLEESLHVDFQKELVSYMNTKWRHGITGKPEVKSLLGKTILLNTAELAAAKLMFELKNECKLSGDGDPCTTNASILTGRILDRITVIHGIEFKTPERMWTDHVGSVHDTLSQFKDKLNSDQIAKLSKLSSSISY